MRRSVSNILVVVFGFLLAAILLGIVFLFFPQLRPDPNVQVVRFTVGIGDMFFNRPGMIAPPSDPNAILSEHRISFDANGFRVPERQAKTYDIVALGDSYTEASNVARPWTDVLAAESGLAVLNLGFRGYGPVEEVRVLETYGTNRGAEIVIVGYFEGNDLYNVVNSGELVEPAVQRSTFPPFDPSVEIWRTDNPGPFQYPLRIGINDVVTEITFLDDYLSWLTADYETYAQSGNIAALATVWQQMQQSAGDACLIIAYFPTAPHIYAPYIVPEDRDQLMATVERKLIAAPGAMIVGDGAGNVSFAESMSMLSNQRDAIADLAARLGLPFIDLTPAFEQAAAQGEILYYIYDTHWNQAGHDLAGRTIADYLAAYPMPCVSE